MFHPDGSSLVFNSKKTGDIATIQLLLNLVAAGPQAAFSNRSRRRAGSSQKLGSQAFGNRNRLYATIVKIQKPISTALIPPGPVQVKIVASPTIVALAGI